MSTPELQETLTPVYPTTEGIKQGDAAQTHRSSA